MTFCPQPTETVVHGHIFRKVLDTRRCRGPWRVRQVLEKSWFQLGILCRKLRSQERRRRRRASSRHGRCASRSAFQYSCIGRLGKIGIVKKAVDTYPQVPQAQRRRLVAMGLAGAVALLTLETISRACAQEKASREEAEYQDSPKDIYMCATCSLFEPPKSCKVVEGDVSPSGWCKLFALAD
jgi:hypothetical protein